MSIARKWMGRTALLAALAASPAQASWWNLLTEDFGPAATSRWTYAGVSNALGQALFRLDATSGVVQAEWNQTNSINGDYVVPPTSIRNSYLYAPIARRLSDRDTFRLRATLYLEPGSIPDTTEFWQLANIGLYDMQTTGPDRALTAPLIKDTSDAVEFNYFIGNAWAGPSISGLVAAALDGLDFTWIIGPSAAMQVGHWLPTGLPLYLELTYHGNETGLVARKLHTALYTDPARTTLLVVNGQPLEEWTSALPATDSFSVSDLAMVNYVGPSFGDLLGEGRGTYDAISVDLAVPESTLAASALHSGACSFTWAATAGTSYAVLFSTNLAAGNWQTQAMVQASGDFAGYTNATDVDLKIYRIEKVEDP